MINLMKVSKWLTLKEVIKDVSASTVPYEVSPIATIITNLNSGGHHITSPLVATFLTNANVIKCWQELYSRFYQEYCVSYENDDSSLRVEAEDEFFNRIVSILNRTYEKYDIILSSYQAQKTHLLDDIGTMTQIKENDTPQVASSSDGFIADNYASKYNQTKHIDNMRTKLDRINEIENNYRLTLQEWTNQFDSLFIEGGNL